MTLLYLSTGVSLPNPLIFDRLLRIVDYSRREKIGRLYNDKNKACGLWSELLMRSVMTNILHKKNSEIVISHDCNGKPYLKNESICFNFSHSNDAVALAVSNKNVGVDVEYVTENSHLGVARRKFTKNELEYSDICAKNFYKVWTRKESYFKMTGQGIFTDEAKKIDTLTPPVCDNIKSYDVSSYVVSVCREKIGDVKLYELSQRGFDETILKMTDEEILNSII